MHFLSLPGSGDMSDNGQTRNDNIAIAFDQVEKGFGERKVLDKVSFSIARGEALCILGRSGTGKSVTLKLMIGLLQADAGKVLVEAEDMGSLQEDGLAKVRRKMGYLFQSAALFDSFTLSENLAIPLHRLDGNKSREEIKRAVEEALREVGLEKDGKKIMKVKTERHTTMVIVTHDIRGARKIADKFAVLDQGRLLAFGTPEELDKKPDSLLQQFISER